MATTGTRIVLTLITFVVSAASSYAQLTAKEREGVIDTLYMANMTTADLEYERKPFHDAYRMSLVDLCLDKPLDGADALMAFHSEAERGPVSRILKSALARGLTMSVGSIGQPTSVSPSSLSAIPLPVRGPVGKLVASILRASSEVRSATERLSETDKRLLIESLPVWAVEEPLVKFDFVHLQPAGQEKILSLLKAVDLKRIYEAGVALMESVEENAAALRKVDLTFDKPQRYRVDGLPIVIGGKEDDVYAETDAALTIDLGGDDKYIGRHGAGIGYASVCIDLGGNDTFDLRDANLGCGLLGIGIAWIEGGDDAFKGGSLCLGSGIAGIGAFVKVGGDDTYRATSLAEGYGQFGVGISLDTAGRDKYDIKLMGQGAARTGGIGWLIDRQGSDEYRAGGLSLNSPLFSDVYYSNAQGYGSGYREDTGGISGGIGLLTDLQGDDFYLAETYAQAASYWFSIGSLYDASGHDTYTGYHYCQASAMHMTAAYLFDLAGDDGYMEKFGASHAIGHDYGVALLLDRAGNDVYAAKDSTPGIGNANGVGIFIDSAGEDRYQGPPGRGNAARGTGSLGLFVDLGGQDLYREGLSDGVGSVGDMWFASYDQADLPRPTDGPSVKQEANPKPGSKPMPSVQEMEALYKRATQWGVGTAQAEVNAAIRDLIAIGMPAVNWMIEKHLKLANRLEQRAFVATIEGVGIEARHAIANQVSSDDLAAAKNAIAICSDGGFKEAAVSLTAALKKPDLQRQASRAAGVLGAKECVNDLIGLCAIQDKLLALNSIVSLSQIADDAAYGTAESLMFSPNLPIRKAALALVAKFPARALETAKLRLLEDDERTVRIAIELLGAIGNTEALKEVGPKLIDPRAGVRIQAMLALNGRCPVEYRSLLISLRGDPIPTVRAIATKVEPGR